MTFCDDLYAVQGKMGTTGNLLIVQRFVTTILYQLLRLVFIPVQWIYWQLNGTAQKRREARLPQNYERSAQVFDVVLCHKFCDVLVTRVDHFLCTHNRFENPQYIIDNDNITLMTVTEHDAVFCETEEKGISIARVSATWDLVCVQLLRTLTTWHSPHSHAALLCAVQQSIDISCRPDHRNKLCYCGQCWEGQTNGRPTDA